MMNFFKPAYCLDLKDESFDGIGKEKLSESKKGTLVILENITVANVFLFFPVSKKEYSLVKQVMSGSKNLKSLTIYNTMIESWAGSDNFLSGIIMDLEYDKSGEAKIVVNLTLSDSDGHLVSMVPISFYDSVIISCLMTKEYLVGNALLSHLFPKEKENENSIHSDNSYPFPEDDGLKDIVKEILDEKSKKQDEDEEDEDEDEELS